MKQGWLALFLGVLVLSGSPASAQGMLLVQRSIPRPHPVPIPPALSIKSQRINLRVESGVVHAETQQVFHNPTSAQLEGTYLFVLPEGAAVSQFRMQVGNEPVDGKMLSVEEARRIYESYVRRVIDPGILEYVGRNTFQARIFPIPPSSDKLVQIAYSHPAEFQNGVYRVHFPMKTDRVAAEPLGELAVQVTIRSQAPIKAIYSPTHEVQVKRTDDHHAVVTFEAKDIRADRDFQLYYSISDREFGASMLATRKSGEDGYFLLMLAPRREIDASQIVAKDVVFVFDTSGSMQGAKIEQARRALTTVLDSLNPSDRFNIFRFSSDVTSFQPGLQAATPENRRAAQEFVAQFRAVGGTAIYDALTAALESLPPNNERRPTFILFMTDGLPTIGEQNVEKILGSVAPKNAGRARVFSFGVGNDVNTLLLDRLARDNGGAADYVAPDEDLEAKIGSFYEKIARPVLANLKLEAPGAQFADVYPTRLPDLFAGTQLLVTGRFKGAGTQSLTLTGEMQGKPQTFPFQVALPAQEREYAFIPKLWANRKISYLLEEIRLHGESAELKDQVVKLSLEFGIITPYTAYLVEEPGLVPPPPGPVPLRHGLEGAPGKMGGLGGAAQGPAEAPPPPSGEELRRYMLQRDRADGEAFRQQVGGRAVQASKAIQQLREQQVAETDLELVREIDSRTFRWQQGAWQDQSANARMRVVQIKYGSEAYFALLKAHPEWTRFLAQGRSLVLRTGRNTVAQIGETGKEQLMPAEMKALTR
ncbi:MAG: VWA domain-containing protein [Armatimonadetes bacterium]|nr:VWA domain-containing protein [Armatimonadota bacterium]